MTDDDVVVELPTADPERLALAVQETVMARSDLAEELRRGAEQSMLGEHDVAVARHFQTCLELGYLVASADGFAAEERVSLAALLEGVVRPAIHSDVLDMHFRDLEESVVLLGRSQRLARAAAEVQPGKNAEEAVMLVALIAMADGRLGRAEYDVIEELGRHTKVESTRVRELVSEVAREVEARLS
jgi:tellurite resistance protein